VGSLVPLAIGTGVGYGFFSLPIREALAAGASLAPTSMGISLKVTHHVTTFSLPSQVHVDIKIRRFVRVTAAPCDLPFYVVVTSSYGLDIFFHVTVVI
jgi:hypothetical protein